MQQILNAKERNQALIQFLIFYLVTIVITIGVIYYNFYMPKKASELLKAEVEKQWAQDANQKEFIGRMEQAKIFLDSLDKSGIATAQVDIQLSGKFTDLEKFKETDDKSYYQKLNSVIIQTMMELQQTKNELVKFRQQAGSDKGLNIQLQECQAQLDQYRIAIAKLNSQ